MEAKERIEAAGRIDFAVAICQGQYMGADNIVHYGIHPLELAYSVLGPGAVAVRNIGEGEKSVVKIDYRDGKILTLAVFPRIDQIFQLNLYGEGGAESVRVEDWDFFYWKMLETYILMLNEWKSPVDLRETLELIWVLTSAKESLLGGGTLFTRSA